MSPQAHDLLSRLGMPAPSPCRVVFRAVFAAVCAILAAGCAANVVGEPWDGDPDGARGDGRVAPADVPDAAPDVRYRDVVTYDVYREDSCPGDSGGAVRMYDCDPLGRPTGCPDGQGCYPYVQYPTEPCGQEVYRASCAPAGRTQTDGFCTSGSDCAPGHACYVTGSGNRCLQLCRLDGGEPSCPRGRVCEPTDMPDYGACD